MSQLVAISERLLEDSLPAPWSANHPYRKWQGAYWRLISLVELGVVDDRRQPAMLEMVMAWLTSPGHLAGVKVIQGRARRCGSQEGNALFVAVALGQLESADILAANLMKWPWPDGGWNCDKRPGASHSSFNESLWPMRGLHAYHEATGDRSALEAAHLAGEFFLRHRLFRSERTGEVIADEIVNIHWPPYWHYDIFHGLRVISAMGWAGRARRSHGFVPRVAPMGLGLRAVGNTGVAPAPRVSRSSIGTRSQAPS